ncbi:hypothetical protein C8R42DRAFT_374435 [Lentinula raphanica]|nr:hypothetical protein C8R42DRAFT_374435 [Lentinula raphanica]
MRTISRLRCQNAESRIYFFWPLRESFVAKHLLDTHSIRNVVLRCHRKWKEVTASDDLFLFLPSFHSKIAKR